MKKLLVKSLLCLLTGCCCHRSAPHTPSISSDTQHYFKHSGWFTGTAVIIHGLNTQPTHVDSIAQILADNGYITVRPTLPGHGASQDVADIGNAWLTSTQHAIRDARRIAPEEPFLVVGYSLGGLLASLALLSPDTPKPDRMVLIAPAIRPRVSETFLALGGRYPFSQLLIPSIAPHRIQRWCAIPGLWYGALEELLSRFHASPDYSRLKEIPTRLILSPGDEVVSFSETEKWLVASGLAEDWSLVPVSPPDDTELEFAHNLPELNRLDEMTKTAIVQTLLNEDHKSHKMKVIASDRSPY